MPDWTSLKWIWWLGLYVVLGIALPWAMARAWMQQNAHTVRLTVRDLFGSGELGLFSLAIATGAIWELQKSDFAPQTIAISSILLGISGVMAALVWVDASCRKSAGESSSQERTWRDSSNLAFLVITMSAVAEILLERYARAVR
jgi:hypothetical protein